MNATISRPVLEHRALVVYVTNTTATSPDDRSFTCSNEEDAETIRQFLQRNGVLSRIITLAELERLAKNYEERCNAAS